MLLVHVRRKLLAGRRVEAPSLGLRLCRSHAADAVHGLVVRPAADAAVPPVPPAARRDSSAAGAVSRHVPSLHTHTPDLFRRYVYEPLFVGVAWIASKLRWLQQGRIQLYVLYIALTILVLLIWKLG